MPTIVVSFLESICQRTGPVARFLEVLRSARETSAKILSRMAAGADYGDLRRHEDSVLNVSIAAYRVPNMQVHEGHALAVLAEGSRIVRFYGLCVMIDAVERNARFLDFQYLSSYPGFAECVSHFLDRRGIDVGDENCSQQVGRSIQGPGTDEHVSHLDLAHFEGLAFFINVRVVAGVDGINFPGLGLDGRVAAVYGLHGAADARQVGPWLRSASRELHAQAVRGAEQEQRSDARFAAWLRDFKRCARHKFCDVMEIRPVMEATRKLAVASVWRENDIRHSLDATAAWKDAEGRRLSSSLEVA